jgi:hypothetical protein
MDLKPGYKQTEVGVIPDDWEAVDYVVITNLFPREGIVLRSGSSYAEALFLLISG